MNRNLKRSVRCKFFAISALFLFSGARLKVSACLVPLKVLLSGVPRYEYQLQVEDRRHNLALLKFRNQTRAVETKFTQDMIDCANTPPEQNCAKKAAAESMRQTKAIQKQEIAENKLHLDNLDKLATFYAFGKH